LHHFERFHSRKQLGSNVTYNNLYKNTYYKNVNLGLYIPTHHFECFHTTKQHGANVTVYNLNQNT
jgi:hypothetical protein